MHFKICTVIVNDILGFNKICKLSIVLLSIIVGITSCILKDIEQVFQSLFKILLYQSFQIRSISTHVKIAFYVKIHNDFLLSTKLILNATFCTKILLSLFFNFNVDAWASTNTYLYFRLKNISVDEIVLQVYEQENRALEFAITHSI